MALAACLAHASDMPGTDILNRLVTEGNMAYELSQSSKIKTYADSISAILESGEIKGNDLTDFTVSMLKLYGNHHYEAERLDSAEVYYRRALDIMGANPDVDFHGSQLLMLREMAQLHYRRGDYKAALDYMEKADDILQYNSSYDIGDNTWLITRMSYAMCLARTGDTEEALKTARTEMECAKDRTSLEYAKAERMYAKILLLSNARREGASKAYRSYFSKQKKDAIDRLSSMTTGERTEYWHTLQPFVRDCYLLEDDDPALMYDVALFSKGLLLQMDMERTGADTSGMAGSPLLLTWQDIQRHLKKDDAAIEFVQYGDNGAERMGAIILRQTGTPVFIPIASTAVMTEDCSNAVCSSSRDDKDNLYESASLQNGIWNQGVLKQLRGIRRVYFAPDGYLHRLAIEYMPQVSDLQLYRLTSTRRLAEKRQRQDVAKPMLAFGAINYDYDKTDKISDENDAKAYMHYIGKYFPNLGNASDETQGIFEQRNSSDDKRLSGAMASESAFRNTAGEYGTIIISSHGDFSATVPFGTDLKPVFGDESMSRHILAFAGINANLRDRKFDSSANFDGLLSANEISMMDLRKCWLFVASTCQSGLGEISADGVFGLQRGLKCAGVDAMLLSLWNVDNDATCILMKEFHHQLTLGLSVRQAFANARGYLLSYHEPDKVTHIFDPATMADRKVTVRGKSFDAPQYANAFILIDAVD